jgi:hypothetical protein
MTENTWTFQEPPDDEDLLRWEECVGQYNKEVKNES